MSKKQPRNTKGKIISAAWKLFYEQGYDDTTIDEIIAESATSKGSFYHYFEGKDALLGSLSFLFDEKYMELEAQLSGFATHFPGSAGTAAVHTAHYQRRKTSAGPQPLLL